MARKFAQVHTDIWEDPDYLALTPEARFTFVACFAQKIVNYAGVLVYSPARMARATGYPVKIVTKALSELHAAGFILLDAETGEILVRSFVANNAILKQPQLRKALERCYADILSEPIKASIVAALPDGYKGPLRPGCEQGGAQGAGSLPPGQSGDPGLRVDVVATDSDVIGNPADPTSLPVENFEGQTPGGWIAANEARAQLGRPRAAAGSAS